MTNNNLSASDQSNLQKVITQYQNKGAFVIEPTDKNLVSFYDAQLALAGVTPTDYPTFFNILQATKLAKTVANTAMVTQESLYPFIV